MVQQIKILSSNRSSRTFPEKYLTTLMEQGYEFLEFGVIFLYDVEQVRLSIADELCRMAEKAAFYSRIGLEVRYGD